MRLAQFLSELFEHGHVRLDAEPPTDVADDRHATDFILAERAHAVSAVFPEPVPAFDPAAAAWAAEQFCQACRFVLFREASIDVVRNKLSRAMPPGEPAEHHFSVDLVWQFLPDLDRLTTTLAPQDPLREILRRWGAERPFSSVGMKGIEPNRVGELLAHDGLCRAYVDRIIACHDASRLSDPRVRDLVHAALGRERARAAAWCQELPPESAARHEGGAPL
jgi:MoxR-vWA-beta-propeller ternary system domain bpX4